MLSEEALNALIAARDARVRQDERRKIADIIYAGIESVPAVPVDNDVATALRNIAYVLKNS